MAWLSTYQVSIDSKKGPLDGLNDVLLKHVVAESKYVRTSE